MSTDESYREKVLRRLNQSDVRLVDLSNRTGYSISYISRVLNGERQPRIHVVAALATALNVSIDRLYEALS